MTAETLLRIAYVANILILVPVVASLALSGSPAGVFGSGVADSPALRILVTALWAGILCCSALGLWLPRPFAGILVLQVIYKSAWLLAFVLPAWRAGQAVPWGPALTFVPIVLIWPVLLLFASQATRP